MKAVTTLLVLCLLLPGSFTLSHKATSRFNAEKYLSDLSQTQKKLQDDLNEVKEQIDSLNEELANTSDDPNEQLKKYNEGIADERDSIYNIQNYLNLPFDTRFCEEHNLTQ